MAWTKINFYLSILFVAIAVFVSLSNMGTDLSNDSDIVLDDNSYDYILELKGMSEDNSFDSIASTSSSESASNDILDSGDNYSIGDSDSFLGNLFIKKERASQPTNFFKLIYNLPTTIVKGVGLPVGNFSWLINIIVYVLVFSILIMVWRDLIRN